MARILDAAAATVSDPEQISLPLLRIDTPLSGKDRVKTGIGSPLPHQIGEIRVLCPPDRSRSQRLDHQMVQAFSSLFGPLPQHTVHTLAARRESCIGGEAACACLQDIQV